MVALHPPLSGFPLTSVTLLVVAEILIRRGSAPLYLRTFLVLATAASCLVAFLSGYQASGSLGELSTPASEALGTHHALGRLLLVNSLLLAVLSWVAKVATHGRSVFRALYLVSLGLQLALTLYVGWLGGALVFDQGLGVRP